MRFSTFTGNCLIQKCQLAHRVLRPPPPRLTPPPHPLIPRISGPKCHPHWGRPATAPSPTGGGWSNQPTTIYLARTQTPGLAPVRYAPEGGRREGRGRE